MSKRADNAALRNLAHTLRYLADQLQGMSEEMQEVKQPETIMTKVERFIVNPVENSLGLPGELSAPNGLGPKQL